MRAARRRFDAHLLCVLAVPRRRDLHRVRPVRARARVFLGIAACGERQLDEQRLRGRRVRVHRGGELRERELRRPAERRRLLHHDLHRWRDGVRRGGDRRLGLRGRRGALRVRREGGGHREREELHRAGLRLRPEQVRGGGRGGELRCAPSDPRLEPFHHAVPLRHQQLRLEQSPHGHGQGGERERHGRLSRLERRGELWRRRGHCDDVRCGYRRGRARRAVGRCESPLLSGGLRAGRRRRRVLGLGGAGPRLRPGVERRVERLPLRLLGLRHLRLGPAPGRRRRVHHR